MGPVWENIHVLCSRWGLSRIHYIITNSWLHSEKNQQSVLVLGSSRFHSRGKLVNLFWKGGGVVLGARWNEKIDVFCVFNFYIY